jgi:hypothetical protein
MNSYTIYLDKEETFECDVSIKNASIKNSTARLIIESDDINLVFFGNITKDTITVPIKSLKKYFTESDKATIKLEVIIENNVVTPWESELIFENYNKVEIKEIKNVKTKPLVEIKVKDYKKSQLISNTEEKVITESKKLTKSLKQKLLESINDKMKKNQVDGKLNREETKEFIKNLISNDL